MLLSGFYTATAIYIADGCVLSNNAHPELLSRKTKVLKAVLAFHLTISTVLLLYIISRMTHFCIKSEHVILVEVLVNNFG